METQTPSGTPLARKRRHLARLLAAVTCLPASAVARAATLATPGIDFARCSKQSIWETFEDDDWLQRLKLPAFQDHLDAELMRYADAVQTRVKQARCAVHQAMMHDA